MKEERNQNMDVACVGQLERRAKACPMQFSSAQISYLKIKRFFDVVISLAAEILLAPVFLLVALVIKLDSPTEKILFKQERVGQNGRVFCMYKFRSMKSNTPELSTRMLTDADQYITPVGGFLRKTSLDELPQIWNVLEGTMSIVGPRPLIKAEEDVHRERARYGVYQLKPGITGLAQINGRDGVDDENKVKLDREYLEKVSLRMDLHILMVTAYKVLRRADVADTDSQKK